MGMIGDFQRAGAERRSQVAAIKSEVALLRSRVAALKRELEAARAAMARELRDSLASARASRASTAAERKQAARRRTPRRISDARGAAAPPPVAVPTEEEAVAVATPVEATAEMAALRDRVFDYLAAHPDGVRLSHLEQEFGLARIHMARVVRSLMDANTVEKRDLLYFAV